MEVVSRTENKLLNRVEIEFRWSHKGNQTPSKKEVMDLVKTLEPGSNPDLIVVKNCKTRYGQALTTGNALIYETEEAIKVEPDYIHERHKGFRSGAPTEEKTEGDE
jgi:ribosomal protein S24E